MREFTSRKEAAKFLGATVSLGKGRMSREATAILDKGIASGKVTIVAAPKPERKAPKPAAVKAERPAPKVRSSDVVDPAPMVWPEGTRVFATDGREGSMKAAEFHCGVSLNWCQCHLIHRTPRAIVGSDGYVPVRLEAPQ